MSHRNCASTTFVNNDDRYIKVDYQMVSPVALRTLIEEFITREGTDYGLVEKDLGEKIVDVTRQLESGEAQIIFNLIEESTNIVLARKTFLPGHEAT